MRSEMRSLPISCIYKLLLLSRRQTGMESSPHDSNDFIYGRPVFPNEFSERCSVRCPPRDTSMTRFERGFSKAGLELEFRDPCKYPALVSMDSAKSNYSRLRIPFQRFSIQAAINGSTRGKLENRNL